MSRGLGGPQQGAVLVIVGVDPMASRHSILTVRSEALFLGEELRALSVPSHLVRHRSSVLQHTTSRTRRSVGRRDVLALFGLIRHDPVTGGHSQALVLRIKSVAPRIGSRTISLAAALRFWCP